MTDREQRKPTILVVDDESVCRRLVCSGLKRIDCDGILEARDGVAAQEILRTQKVDVVITDLMMPHLDGLALMRWGNEEIPGLSWIVLSGLDTFDAAVDAIHLGAFDFLAKPPQLRQLELTVRNALCERRLRAEKNALHRSLEERVAQLESLCLALSEQAEVIRSDLGRAEVIQGALLPKSPPIVEGFSLNALYRPGHELGGDLYAASLIDERHLALCIADASGHGVAAAMLSVLLKERLHLIEQENGRPLAPARVLEALNHGLVDQTVTPGMFVTAAYCVLDLRERELVFAAAGHPPLLQVTASGGASFLERTGPALGLRENARYGEKRVKLAEGDRLLFYTDGLLGLGEDVTATLTSVCARLREPGSGQEILEELYRRATVDCGDADRDDVTLLLLDVRDGTSAFDNAGDAHASLALAGEHAESLYLAADETRVFVRVEGRGTWRESEAFYRVCSGALHEGRALVIDFSACVYLDSTLLGTVHEVVSEAEQKSVCVRLRGLSHDLGALFEELSMERVLACVAKESEPLPRTFEPVGRTERDAANVRGRILRAHDVLSSLSESNREQFHAVVESLRLESTTD